MFLKEVSDFSYDNSEDLGNAFEYLLFIMGSQGDAGQFPHTPPHHRYDGGNRRPEKERDYSGPGLWYSWFSVIIAYRHILAQNKDEDGKSTLTG